MTVSGGAGEPTRWAPLTSFALCTFYVTLVFWLTVWVVVPSVVMQWQPLAVTSGSMSPLIRVGDVVLVGEHDPGVTYDAGTVIAFRDVTRDDRVVTHRVAGVNEHGHYLTKGDANAVNDAVPVDPDHLVGVGRLLVPMIGLPLTWLQSGSIPLFTAWLVATVLACAVASKRPDEPDAMRSEPDEPDATGSRPDIRELEPALSGPRRPGLLRSTGIRTARRLGRVGRGGHVGLLGRVGRVGHVGLLGRVGRVGRIGRLADRIGVPAPIASRARTHGPLIATFGATVTLADAPVTFSAGAAAAFAVLIADPRGPELRIGCWLLAVRRVLGRAPDTTGPRTAVLRPAVATLLVVAVAVVAVPRTAAAFSATTTNPANSWQAGSLAAAPANLRGSCRLTKGERFVDLAWDEPADVAGLTGYRVEVAPTSGGPYTVAGTVPATATSLTYEVTSLENNVSYHFVVRAVVGGWSGSPSNEVAAHFLGVNCSVG